MTNEIKELGKTIIEPLVLKRDKFETDRLLNEAFEKFKELPLTTTCKLMTIKTYNTYVIPESHRSNDFIMAKGAQQHIRAAHYYNMIIKKAGLTHYKPIQEGDTCQIIPLLKTNKFQIDCLAVPNGEIPPEFKINDPDSPFGFMVNYNELFNKPFYACISSLYEVCGWKCKDFNDQHAFDLFDIF